MGAFSKFNLQDSQVVYLLMEGDPRRVTDPAESKRLLLGFDVQKKDASGDGKVAAQIMLSASYRTYDVCEELIDEDDTAFRLDVTARGIVVGDFLDGVSESDIEHYLAVNGVAMLFHEVKTYMALLSGLSPAGKVMVPEIDASEIVREHDTVREHES